MNVSIYFELNLDLNLKVINQNGAAESISIIIILKKTIVSLKEWSCTNQDLAVRYSCLHNKFIWSSKKTNCS